MGESLLKLSGGLDGNAASRRGTIIEWTEPGVRGIAMLEGLLSGVLTCRLLTLLLSMLNVSLLKIAGSIVSRGSSGMVVACTGRLYAVRSSNANLGGGMLLGETGGESSYRECSKSTVLFEVTDDSSGIVAKAD